MRSHLRQLSFISNELAPFTLTSTFFLQIGFSSPFGPDFELAHSNVGCYGEEYDDVPTFIVVDGVDSASAPALGIPSTRSETFLGSFVLFQLPVIERGGEGIGAVGFDFEGALFWLFC